MTSDLFRSWSHFIFGCRVQYLSSFLRILVLKLVMDDLLILILNIEKYTYMEILVFSGFFNIFMKTFCPLFFCYWDSISALLSLPTLVNRMYLKSVHFKKTVARISFPSKLWYFQNKKYNNFERKEIRATVSLKWEDFSQCILVTVSLFSLVFVKWFSYDILITFPA